MTGWRQRATPRRVRSTGSRCRRSGRRAELGVRLGVSKQAAGKTIDGLEARGYVTRSADRVDVRRKLIAITPTGRDLLARSAAIFERLRSDRVALLGEEQMAEVEAALRVLAPAASFPLDAAGWFGG